MEQQFHLELVWCPVLVQDNTKHLCRGTSEINRVGGNPFNCGAWYDSAQTSLHIHNLVKLFTLTPRVVLNAARPEPMEGNSVPN
jgi:hypothetical protein